MSHARTQIRESCATRMMGLATTGSNVFQSRMYAPESLPCLLVTTNDEEVSPGSIGNMQERVLQLVVRGFAKGGTTLDDTLDQIALEVETAMSSESRAVLDTVEIDYDDSLEKPVGSIALKYRVTYFTAENNPATII